MIDSDIATGAVILSVAILFLTHNAAYNSGKVTTEDTISDKDCTSHYPDATYKAHKLCVKKLLEN